MATRELDIRGLICPVTWARVKREILTMTSGDLLHITLDHRPAVSDIKRNAADLGHEIIAATESDEGVWRLVLEYATEPS